MADANFERALELFAAAWKESPGHAAVARDFPEAVEGLKRAGDEAFRQGRPEDAGKRWEAAIRYVGHPAARGKTLSFTRGDVQKALDKLSESLMERGLLEYRKGNLEAAIAYWRAILAYNPSHPEAARSVQTATTQLENLKKIAPRK